MKGIDEACAGGSRGLKRSSRSLATHPHERTQGPLTHVPAGAGPPTAGPCLGAHGCVRVRVACARNCNC